MKGIHGKLGCDHFVDLLNAHVTLAFAPRDSTVVVPPPSGIDLATLVYMENALSPVTYK